MGTLSPVEVGSRGTIASLVLQEIEYYNSLKLGKKENKHKNKKNNKLEVTCKLMPSMCKAVDIAENFHVQRIVRTGCKNSNTPDSKELLPV
jgi:hypothetical protein